VLHQRAQRHHDGDGLDGRMRTPESEQALMHGADGCGPDLVRHRFALRERQHALLAEPGGELRAPAPRTVLARRDHDDRPPRHFDERCPREGACTCSGIGDLRRTPVLEPFGELAETLASFGEREDATETSGGYGCRGASH
jgi:hypothetical protein